MISPFFCDRALVAMNDDENRSVIRVYSWSPTILIHPFRHHNPIVLFDEGDAPTRR